MNKQLFYLGIGCILSLSACKKAEMDTEFDLNTDCYVENQELSADTTLTNEYGTVVETLKMDGAPRVRIKFKEYNRYLDPL